jgi:hypothetical protein
VFLLHIGEHSDTISCVTKTETFLVTELDQEIARFNERLRQLRALSPDQRIKHLAARAQELRVGRARRVHMMPQQEDEWNSRVASGRSFSITPNRRSAPTPKPQQIDNQNTKLTAIEKERPA